MQKSPSIFNSSVDKVTNSYSAILGQKLTVGKYRISSHSQGSIFVLEEDDKGTEIPISASAKIPGVNSEEILERQIDAKRSIKDAIPLSTDKR